MLIPSGMGVYRFEDLRVWQAAKRQCDRVGELITRPEFRRDAELSDQMNAAAISVMFNISEGFLRRRDPETLQFLRYAFASNGELKSGYYAATGRTYLPDTEAADLIVINESVAKMLRRWMSTLDPGPPSKRRPWTKDQGRAQDQGQTKDQGNGPRTKDGPRTKA
jgi:four helix bundle protein